MSGPPGAAGVIRFSGRPDRKKILRWSAEGTMEGSHGRKPVETNATPLKSFVSFGSPVGTTEVSIAPTGARNKKDKRKCERGFPGPRARVRGYPPTPLSGLPENLITPLFPCRFIATSGFVFDFAATSRRDSSAGFGRRGAYPGDVAAFLRPRSGQGFRTRLT